MRNIILENINDPAQLERLYRADKQGFKRAFNALYPDVKDNILVRYWNERLNFSDDIAWGNRKELLFVVLGSLLAAFIAKLPAIFSINEEFFYPRNIGFIIFPILTAWFVWKHKISTGKIAVIFSVMLGGVIFINSIPDLESDTLVLSCIHLVLLLWSILGFAFVGGLNDRIDKRLDFLKFNGDLVVITTLILIAGAVLSGITIGLFSLIGFGIERFYFEYIVVCGLAAAPIVGTWLTRTNPQLVGKVSPVIARIFSPLVLVMLVIYLVAIVYSGKDPYNDREFLIMFNALLIGVMALIFFSVAETSRTAKSRSEILILLLLSLITILVNSIALSAILFRISEWGITPNRAAVLGGNVLILINLLMVTAQLFRALTQKTDTTGVGKAIAVYLPVYAIWTIIVTFLFPLLFGF